MVHNSAQAAVGQEVGQEMTRSCGIPDSALGTEMGSLGSSGMAGLGIRTGASPEGGAGVLGMWGGHESNSLGSLPPGASGASVRAFTDDRGCGTLRSSRTKSRSFPQSSGCGSVFPGGFLPGKKTGAAQERVKWSAERMCLPGGQVGMLPCHTLPRASYVRNEPAHPQLCPGNYGATQAGCPLWEGGTGTALFLLPACLCPCLCSPSTTPNWHLASAQGDRGQVSRWPAA